MQSAQHALSGSRVSSPAIQSASDITPLNRVEAPALARAELSRILPVIESLEGDDWQQPTACTLWTVREMVAHLAGCSACYASWGEFARQYLLNPYMRQEAEPVDGINRRQVEDRADAAPEELVAEFRECSPKAIRTRARLPWLLRIIPLNLGDPVGYAPISYLIDTIFTRDWWLHRLDICRATGRTMKLDSEHDARITELAMLDIAKQLAKQGAATHTVIVELTGPAGGTFHYGPDRAPDAVIQMDALDFHWMTSGRATPEEGLAQATVQGDREVARSFLQKTRVLY